MAIKVPKLITKQGIDTFFSITGFVTPMLLKEVFKMVFKRYIGMDEAIIGFSTGGKIGGYAFHIVENENISMESDITDHYIESNKSIQDHVAIKPVQITLKGLVGRYFYDVQGERARSGAWERATNFIASLMPNVSSNDLAKKVKSTVGSAIGNNLLKTVADYIVDFGFGIVMDKLREIGTDFFDLFSEIGSIEDEQTKAFLYLENLWELAVPVTVVTSWKAYDDMIITNLKPTRDSNGDITEFTVTLKQISFVNSIIINENKSSEPTNTQMQGEVDNGKTKGVKVDSDDVIKG